MQLACQAVIVDRYSVPLASICLVFRTMARHSDWLGGVACFCGAQGTWSAVSCFDTGGKLLWVGSGGDPDIHFLVLD